MTWKDRDKRKASFEKFSNIQSQSHKNNYTPHIENDAENPKNAITLTEYFDLHNDPNDLCMIRTIVFEYDVWFAGVDIVRVFYDSYYAGDVIRRVLTQSEYMLLPLSKVPRNLPEWSKTPQLYIVNQTGARKLFKYLMRNTRDIRDVQPMHAAVECFIYNAKKIISNLHGESVLKTLTTNPRLRLKIWLHSPKTHHFPRAIRRQYIQTRKQFDYATDVIPKPPIPKQSSVGNAEQKSKHRNSG